MWVRGRSRSDGWNSTSSYPIITYPPQRAYPRSPFLRAVISRLTASLVALCILAACNRAALAPALVAYDAEALYAQDFSGILVVDLASGETLAERNADRLYTPASNVKLLTLATALAWLPADSLPALAYRYDGDTLRLWATAYPGLGDPRDAAAERIRRRLAAHAGPVEVNLHGYVDLPRFGSGWMWDDYPYAFARERSGLPVYGNLLRAWRDPVDSSWAAQPDFVVVRPRAYVEAGRSRRAEHANRFRVGADTPPGDTIAQPLYAAADLAAQLLEDWTGRPIRYHNRALPADWGSRVWAGRPRDELLRAMMLPSDNFLAEHLLLQAGLFHADLTDERELRERAQREALTLPDSALAWADGSGISHYNLVSPRALVEVVRRTFPLADTAFAKAVLPTGGRTGTLAKWYGGPRERPYVYAKTGTLRHNHALSGLLRARSGRWLAFSLMHNHYRGGSEAYKEAMSRTLAAIRDAY